MNLFIIGLSKPGGGEIMIILAIVILLFGGRKIPELMKGIGQGMRDFKKASKGEEEPESKATQEKIEK